MRLKILKMVFACLTVATSASANDFEIGPRLALSAPTGRAGSSADVGFNAGVTATIMETSMVGVGVELDYHHWPGSPDANAAIDALFSNLGGVSITGSKLSWGVFQGTLHVKVAPPVRGTVAPWFQAGGGIYRVNTHLKLPEAQLQAAGWQVTNGSSTSGEDKFGFVGRAGFDAKYGGRMRLGVDASYHFLLWRDGTGPHFTVFTIGAHMLL